jgi:hypothetical protein
MRPSEQRERLQLNARRELVVGAVGFIQYARLTGFF